MAPGVGLAPTLSRLTGGRATLTLPWMAAPTGYAPMPFESESNALLITLRGQNGQDGRG